VVPVRRDGVRVRPLNAWHGLWHEMRVIRATKVRNRPIARAISAGQRRAPRDSNPQPSDP
jgi:hypothetical protein